MGTREKILAAAREHFVQAGLARASVRTITDLAGVNSALLRYHFGTKAALYEEVVREAAASMIQLRLAELASLRAQAGTDPIPLIDLLTAYARPVLADDRPADTAVYLRLFGRLYTEPDDELNRMTQAVFSEVQMTFSAELAKSVPELSHEELALRFAMMIGALTLFGTETQITETLAGPDSSAEGLTSLESFVRASIAFFHAPQTR